MALKGDLASVDLAQVFQMLALNQKVGLLSIQSPEIWRALYFDSRGVTLYYNEHTLVDGVLTTLVRSGQLAEDAVQSAREHAVSVGMSVVDSLLAGGYITEDHLEDLYRTQLEEDIYDLFFWTDARFEFYEGATSFDGREGCISDRLFFSTDSMIMEAARRIDEWAYITEQVPGPHEMFSPLELPLESRLAERELAIYDLVDGKRNVARIVEASGQPSFHVYKSLAALLDDDAIHCTPERELQPQAQACTEDGRLQDAINLYERAIGLEVGLPDIHAKVSLVYEAAEEYELAASHLRTLAEYQVDKRDLRGAMDNLQRVLQLIPTDLDTRCRLVELAMGNSDVRVEGFDPIATGKELVDLYLEMGEVGRVRSILERLLRENPRDIELKKILVNVHTKTGDTKRVVELYESMAQDLVSKGQTIEAISFLQKILRIDRARSDINDRIRSLYRLDERRRSRKRGIFAVVILGLIATALGVGYLLYDDYARRAFDGIDVNGLVEAGEYTAAEQIYSEFADRYPLSPAAADARAEQSRIGAMRQAHAARVERENAARVRELERLRARYRLAFDRFKEEFAAGKPEAALRTLEQVRTAVRDETGEPDDLRWAQTVKLEDNHRQLKALLGAAVALERELRQAVDEQRWPEARALAVRLVTDYDITRTAAQAKIPVQVDSRPAGARILVDGQPLTRKDDGGVEVPVVTPATILLAHGSPRKVVLQLDGFDPRELSVDPKAVDRLHEILTVRPHGVLRFRNPVTTGLGGFGGVLAAGLRDGEIGLARFGRVFFEGKLANLASVESIPTVTADRIYYFTNLGAMVSRRLTDGRVAAGWPIQLDHQPLHAPVITDGRMLLADTEGRLVCLDPQTGRRIWLAPLDGLAGGRPTLENRQVLVGTASGRLMVLDAADGTPVRRYVDIGVGIASRIQPIGSLFVFGTTDGFLRAIDSRGVEKWRIDLARGMNDDQFLTDGGRLYAQSGQRGLLRLDPADGRIVAQTELAGEPQPGFQVGGDRLAVVLRVVREGEAVEDVLSVRDSMDLTPNWDYRDGGLFRGRIALDSNLIFVPGSGGEVVSFR